MGGTRSVAAAIAACVCVSGCAREALPCGPTRARVERVIDGDTVVLEGGQKLRYLLIDANELPGGCYAEEARDENVALVEGREVDIEYDEVCTDKYGRLLGYVVSEGRDVNRALVEEGLACVLYIPPDGGERRRDFEVVERTAMATGAGMWSACAEVACAH